MQRKYIKNEEYNKPYIGKTKHTGKQKEQCIKITTGTNLTLGKTK